MSQLGWCPFCKLPMMKLSTDKKGRPYSICEACRTTSFFKQQTAYNNFLQLMKDTEAKGEDGMLELIAKRLGMVKAPVPPKPVEEPSAIAPASKETA